MTHIGTMEAVGALRLARRELCRRAKELNRRGQFVGAGDLADAAETLDRLRYRLDRRLEELERKGTLGRKAGMPFTLDEGDG